MLDIKLFSENDEISWDGFVLNSNNGTIFHSRRFLNYHPVERFKDHSLLFLKKGKIAALFPAVLRKTDKGSLLASHTGASFGGFVVSKEINLKGAFELVESLLEYAKSNKFAGIDLTPPPIFYSQKIENYIDFALFRNQFAYRKREVSSFVTLDFDKETVLSVFKNEARTAVRRSQKLGIRVVKSDDYKSFYEILERNLKMRHNVTPTHTLEELVCLSKLFPDQIKLYGAFLDQQMIAGVVMFHCNTQVTLAFYISHNEEFQEYRPVNLLFYEIFKGSIQNRFRYLDFGIFTVNMDPNWGLARFKENFGSKGIFRDSFEKWF
jgi:hypothetical protein